LRSTCVTYLQTSYRSPPTREFQGPLSFTLYGLGHETEFITDAWDL